MTDTSKDAVDRLVLAMILRGNTTVANMLTAIAVERDAANARADQARDDALVEACGERYNEMMSRVAYDLVSVGNRHQRRAHEAKFRKANK